MGDFLSTAHMTSVVYCVSVVLHEGYTGAGLSRGVGRHQINLSLNSQETRDLYRLDYFPGNNIINWKERNPHKLITMNTQQRTGQPCRSMQMAGMHLC